MMHRRLTHARSTCLQNQTLGDNEVRGRGRRGRREKDEAAEAKDTEEASEEKTTEDNYKHTQTFESMHKAANM